MAVQRFLNCTDAQLLIKGTSYYEGLGQGRQMAIENAKAIDHTVPEAASALLYQAGWGDETHFWTDLFEREDAAGIQPEPFFPVCESSDMVAPIRMTGTAILKTNYDRLQTRIDTLRAAEGQPPFQWETHPTFGTGEVYSRPHAHARYPTDLRIAMQTWKLDYEGGGVVRKIASEAHTVQEQGAATRAGGDAFVRGKYAELGSAEFPWSWDTTSPADVWSRIKYVISTSGAVYTWEAVYYRGTRWFRINLSQLPSLDHAESTVQFLFPDPSDPLGQGVDLEVLDIGEDPYDVELYGGSPLGTESPRWDLLEAATSVASVSISGPGLLTIPTSAFTVEKGYIYVGLRHSTVHPTWIPPDSGSGWLPGTIEEYALWSLGSVDVWANLTVDRWYKELVGIAFEP